MMNHPDDWGFCYKTGPPWHSVSDIIDDSICILGQSSHQQWGFQVYSESSSSSQNLDAVTRFFLLSAREPLRDQSDFANLLDKPLGNFSDANLVTARLWL